MGRVHGELKFNQSCGNNEAARIKCVVK